MLTIEQETAIYTNPDWTLPNPDDAETVKALDAEWDKIKNEHKSFDDLDVNAVLDRIYAVSFGDSGIRQALFHRICEHYDVDYCTVYEEWLYEL